jgi:signal peptidase I
LKNKPRKPWLAGLLTFFTLGLGHLYYGDVKKGIFLFAGGQLFLIIAFSSFHFYAPIGPIIAIICGIAYLIYCIADSVSGAKAYKNSYSMKRYNKWYMYILYWFVASFVIQTIVEVTVKSNIAQAYKIPSGAMMDTLQIGDHIMADKFTYKLSKPKRGDIVIFPFPNDPSKDYIKRIVALGGEAIEIMDKKVMINGIKLDEPYTVYSDLRIFPKNINQRDNFGPVTVPDDSFFVMGDNRDQSNDSRFWGFVKKHTVKGKAMSIYWSWDKKAGRVRWDRIGNKIH